MPGFFLIDGLVQWVCWDSSYGRRILPIRFLAGFPHLENRMVPIDRSASSNRHQVATTSTHYSQMSGTGAMQAG
jgi:hypothetical protein